MAFRVLSALQLATFIIVVVSHLCNSYVGRSFSFSVHFNSVSRAGKPMRFKGIVCSTNADYTTSS